MRYDRWIDEAEKEGVSRDKWKHIWNRYGNLSIAVLPCNGRCMGSRTDDDREMACITEIKMAGLASPDLTRGGF